MLLRAKRGSPKHIKKITALNRLKNIRKWAILIRHLCFLRKYTHNTQSGVFIRSATGGKKMKRTLLQLLRDKQKS